MGPQTDTALIQHPQRGFADGGGKANAGVGVTEETTSPRSFDFILFDKSLHKVERGNHRCGITGVRR